MSVLDELVAVRELLSDRKRWTRKALARDKHSHPTWMMDPRAVRWCVRGAFRRVWAADVPDTLEDEAFGRGYKGLTHANDSGGHRLVLELLDRAIEAERSGQ